MSHENRGGFDDSADESDHSLEHSVSFMLNDEDLWDDTLLIKMYESSQQQINEALVKRFTENEKEEDKNNNNNSTNKLDSKSGTKNRKNPISKPKPGKESSRGEELHWNTGDYCRVAYLKDNVEYEAKIMWINEANKTCSIQYIGYKDEEIRGLCDLKQSGGEYLRNMQIKMAIEDGYLEEERNEPVEEKVKSSSFDPNPPPSPIAKSDPPMPSFMPGTSRVIPPPPSTLTPATNNDDEEDALASMLMSWYMTGYHTGYYQAVKDAKRQQQQA